MTEFVRFDNPAAAVQTRVLIEDGRVLIQTAQDTAPILAGNMRARGFYEPAAVRATPGRFRWVARIPAVVVLALNRRGIMRGAEVLDEKAFLRFLDDSEHRHLRTDNGRRLRNLPGRGRL